jgi:DNA-binding NtrC family response regulator
MTPHLGVHASSVAGFLQRLSEGAPDREFLGEVLDALAVALDCERVFLFRLRPAGGFHVLAARTRDGETLIRPTERMSHHAVRKMARTGAVLFVPDARQDRRYRPVEAQDGRRMAMSILAIPLRWEGEVRGGIYADHRFRPLRPPARDDGTVNGLVAIVLVALRLRETARAARRWKRSGEGGRTVPPERPGRRLAGLPPAVAPSLDAARREVEEFHALISANPDFRDIFDTLRNLAPSDLPVLLQGETGTGKGLLARALHASSIRRDRPFVPLHAAAVPDTLIESELLGHVKGAFTGADADHEGIFVRADGGTLFLDEVADMSPEFQKKLLRVLEDGRVRALGRKEVVQVDVRLVASTSRDLERLVRQGRFRRDLYFRLKGVVLDVPPLRERREDILPLADLLLARHAAAMARPVPALAEGARARLLRHLWPGNVRELENEMRRLVALGVEDVGTDDLAPGIAGAARHAGGGLSLEEAVEAAERDAVVTALRLARGNKSLAARHLGVTRKSLYRRMAKYGIPPGAPGQRIG